MKTLDWIQKLAKVGRIISKIVFIFSIVGAICTAVGIASLAVLGENAIVMGDYSIGSIIQDDSGMNIPTMIASMAVGLVVLIAEAFISRFAETYFKNELADGTPFTARGAKELKRLGIICIAFSLGAATVCGIGLAVACALVPSIQEAAGEVEDLHSVGIGIGFIICSLLCRLGAESSESKAVTTETVPTETDE